ncbi:aspartate/glutamate racemase family protein [Sphaerisporangium perillae]|uniref:aspartate/glutamate racemase family protein n=1 Tax=Sphaerisporangium perillae TaxID=2935860 RepID=UPI00200C8636|nr:aspartate/glutamate racemase family protein [Sphaerisporangium perillae]
MDVLGVLGGMGPLASAEFLKTLYHANLRSYEQDMPRVLLDSDPGFPDRTQAVDGPGAQEIGDRLTLRLGDLLARGATRLVMACFTAHHFLPLVDPAVRRRLTSLVDVTLTELDHAEGRFLLLCTEGTRRARIFENAPLWDRVAGRVALPGELDQELVHRMVYRMKRHGALGDIAPAVDRLRARYGCSGVILGCTEFHLVADRLVALRGEGNVIDALRAIARTAEAPYGKDLQHAG